MTTFKAIVVDLTYEQDYTEERLYGVDISAHLLIILDSDERVTQLEEEGPADFQEFGDLIQDDPILDADQPFGLSGDFSLREALAEATANRYGDDLLNMWHGWKAEAEEAGVLTGRIQAAAAIAAERLEYDLQHKELFKAPGALRQFVRAVLKQPGALDIVADELANGDYALVDTMKVLRHISPES